MKIGLSQTKHFPVLFLEGSKEAFPLWAYGFLSKLEKSNLLLDNIGVAALTEIQRGIYKPPFSLKGKTILDFGACCGETAWYYLKILGASKVFCVECDPQRVSILNENKRRGLNIEVIAEPASLSHLKLPYDFIKCDIEGHESILLDYLQLGNFLRPCILEVHNYRGNLKDMFLSKGFRVVAAYSQYCFIMSNCSSDAAKQSSGGSS